MSEEKIEMEDHALKEESVKQITPEKEPVESQDSVEDDPDDSRDTPEESTMSPLQARPIVEGILFASHEPLSVKRISNIIKGISGKDIRKIILELQEEYDAQGRGFQILEVAKGFQMATRAVHSEYIIQLSRHKKRNPLTTAALETLAIIAYKQPIIRAEIEAVRGVDSSGVIRSLVDNDQIRIVGRKEVIGRPPLYGTTDEFLKVFGLRKLSDSHNIRELRKMYGRKVNHRKKD